MKILIIEDEVQAAEHLKRLLNTIDDDLTVMTCLTSVVDSVHWLQKNPAPQLIFMDIQLSDGISFSIFEHVEVNAPIIFTTAYDKYALKAFKVNSIDYLLKPIAQKELRQAISKWKKITAAKPSQKNIGVKEIQSILQVLKPSYKQRFLVKAGHHLRSIPVQEIVAFLSREKTTLLVHENGRQYPIDYSLSDLEEMVDPSLFFRINRQDMLSHQIISDVISYSSRLKIISKILPNSEMIVSRDRMNDFRGWLDQ